MIWKLLHWIGMREQEACMRENDYIKLEKERDALEAKLAKAVEATEMMLGRYLLYCGGEAMPFAGHTDQKIVAIARTTLAEIKGESHE